MFWESFYFFIILYYSFRLGNYLKHYIFYYVSIVDLLDELNKIISTFLVNLRIYNLRFSRLEFLKISSKLIIEKKSLKTEEERNRKIKSEKIDFSSFIKKDMSWNN